MITRHESLFQTFDETKIFIRKWTKPEAKAWIFLTHGQAEHSGCYDRFVEGLGDAPVNVLGWDLRGHGRSEGKRGYAREFMDYVRDYAIILDFAKNQVFEKSPYFLAGHSMGALITLRYLADQASETCRGLLLSSPLMGVALPVPAWKSQSAKILNVLAPRTTLSNEIQFSQLSSDRTVTAEYDKDSFRHDKISAGVFLGFESAWQYVESHANRASWPLLLQISAKDRVVSAAKSRDLFELWRGPKSLVVYENSEHELFNDIERTAVFAKCTEFIKEQLP